MKNKEIEELLNKIKNSIKKHKEEDFQDDMLVILELDVIQWNLLLSYIEQLEKELKEEQEDNYKQSEWLVEKQKKIEQLETDCKEANESVTWWQNRFNAVERDKKQLENNRDKAIEILGNYKHYSTPSEEQNSENEDIVDNAYNILKGDSDD